MGKQLEHPEGGLPCLMPSCKPAGGWKVVNARKEDPGGGWRRRFSTSLFNFSQKASQVSLCAVDWQPAGYEPVFGRGEEGSSVVESESFIVLIVFLVDYFVIFISSA